MIPEIMGLIDDEERHDEEDDEYSLGPCGCTDYHMSDCQTRTGTYDDEPTE